MTESLRSVAASRLRSGLLEAERKRRLEHLKNQKRLAGEEVDDEEEQAEKKVVSGQTPSVKRTNSFRLI